MQLILCPQWRCIACQGDVSRTDGYSAGQKQQHICRHGVQFQIRGMRRAGAHCSAGEEALGQVLLVVLLKDVLLLQIPEQHHDSVQHGVHLILVATLERLQWQKQ